jgi:hypothetical protein
MPMKVKNKVNSFLYLHNDINKNLLLPNVSTFNIFSNKVHGDVSMEKILSMTSTRERTLMHVDAH